jgi:ABC-type bacteriocin/lantibiotic exporter with double-glycine peptidase domain
MPRLPAFDDFPYVGQEEDSRRCVPACVEMVCAFLGVDKDSAEIDEEVGYSIDDGTPFESIEYLKGVLAFKVSSVDEAALELERGLPTIANLRITTPEVLGYAASQPYLHAVVVVDVQTDAVRFFDPDAQNQLSTSGPTECTREPFERAWRSGWVLRRLPGS